MSHKVKVAGVMNLPCVSVPAIDQNRVTGLRLDRLGVLDVLPRQLRESLPLKERTPFLLPESIFLSIGSIPNPVHQEIRHVKYTQSDWVPVIDRRCMVC